MQQNPTNALWIKLLPKNNLKSTWCASMRGIAGVINLKLDTTPGFVNTRLVEGTWNPVST